MTDKRDRNDFDEQEEERIPIYSYPARYRWIFSTFLILGTVAVGASGS